MDQKKICKIRDIYRAITDFENTFSQSFGISINEAMLLCTILERQTMTAGDIADTLGVTQSNASKIIRMVEDKHFITRSFGTEDHRQMVFTLSKEGKKKIETLKCSEIPIPDMLQKVI